MNDFILQNDFLAKGILKEEKYYILGCQFIRDLVFPQMAKSLVCSSLQNLIILHSRNLGLHILQLAYFSFFGFEWISGVIHWIKKNQGGL